MADIFLSYKREDRDKVRPLVEALQAQSWSVWWDNRIGAGETWDQVIEAELRAAKCVLVVWSKRSIESDWVRAEAHDGRERKRLIPIIVEGVTPPSIFRMIQATDLSSWKGERDDPNFSHVCAGIARLLRLDEVPAEPPPPPVTPVEPVPAVAIPVGTEFAAEKLLPAQAEVTKPVNLSMPTEEPAAAEPAKHEPVGLASALPLQTPAPAETAPAENVPTPVRAPERSPPDPRFAIAIAAAVALLVGVGSTYLLLSHRNAVMGATGQSSSGTNASAAEPLPAPSTTLSPQEAPRTASDKADPPPPELPKSVPDAAAAPSVLAALKPSANDLAIETQTRIIDNDPRNADAFLARGIAYVSKFEQDNAISDLTQAIEINPKSAAAFTYRGLAYRRKGDNKRALAEYARAIAINANYADAYNNRGYLKNSEKDFDGARADFNRAISINGKYAEAYYGRGASYHGLLDYESAIRDYNKSIEIDDKNATYFNGRGVAYHDRAYLRTKSADDYAKAIADYSKAIDLNPNFAAAFKNRGFSRRMTNDLEGAVSDYTKAIGISPRWTQVITWRGFAYELRGRSGDRALAEADYLEALKIDPNYENAKRNLKDLRDKR